MAATVLFDSLNGLRDVIADSLENDCVLVWIASTNSWVPRPYNDGSGDPGSVVIGNSVVGGYAFHVLYVDEDGKLNQWQHISQDMVKDLLADLSAKAPKLSPFFKGSPLAAAPNLDDNSLRIATTGFVQGQGFERSENKGQAYGYPSLDSTGRIPMEQLPTSVVEPPVRSGTETAPRAGGPVVGPTSNNPDPGIIRFTVAVKDSYAPKSALFKGSDHGNKLCYKDEHGIVHELYS